MYQLAKAVMSAAQIREESFDQKSCDAESKIKSLFDTDKFYSISLYDACIRAAELAGYDNRGAIVIYMLLKNSWNDALNWAQQASTELRRRYD